MFFHNFKYSFITLFRNKFLIFWTFAFPIILGFLFYMAFSEIENSEKLSVIDIAIVDNKEFKESEILKNTFASLSDKNNDDCLFNINYTSLENANNQLNDGDISGYILVQEKPKIVIKRNGINETVLKLTVEQIIEMQKVIDNLYAKTSVNEISSSLEYSDLIGNNFNDEIISNVKQIMSSEYKNIKDISRNNLSYTMIEFYTLIAMACLYGGILGMVSVNKILANMSNNGKRISIAPTVKWKAILSSVLASYCIQLIGITLLFLFTIFILHVDYGNNLFLVLLLAAIGSLAGLSFGVAVSVLLKTNENVKTGIIISFTMLGSFFSGMMGITMKYIIDKNVPFINMINPANMITDGFYSLYYYDTLDRFFNNIISLIIFISLMLIISVWSLRRQKYDSI